jgi:hypothetical protein
MKGQSGVVVCVGKEGEVGGQSRIILVANTDNFVERVRERVAV